jgi:uncharacterized membrane protein YphA (DoxX/SURF4 family)
MPALLDRLDARRVAQISGLVFIPAGLVKFVFHHWELHAFRDFGIPAASVMEPIVGGLETLGGALLLRGVLIVPTAFVLAVIMLVAFVAGGIIHASVIPSDTLAPMLLGAMLYLIGTGLRSPDRPDRPETPDRPHSPGIPGSPGRSRRLGPDPARPAGEPERASS